MEKTKPSVIVNVPYIAFFHLFSQYVLGSQESTSKFGISRSAVRIRPKSQRFLGHSMIFHDHYHMHPYSMTWVNCHPAIRQLRAEGWSKSKPLRRRSRNCDPALITGNLWISTRQDIPGGSTGHSADLIAKGIPGENGGLPWVLEFDFRKEPWTITMKQASLDLPLVLFQTKTRFSICVFLRRSLQWLDSLKVKASKTAPIVVF